MRTGLFVPQGWRLDLVDVEPAEQWRTMLDVARRAEAGSWESVWVYDHFHTTPHPTQEATHEAWTLMAALAAATDRIRLGQMCTCMGYRHPAHLAKIAATVDAISGGRVEMGIGAGWYEHEFRAYGYGFPGTGERIGRLRDGVQIMQRLWHEGEATLEGEWYSVDGAICQPQPLQRRPDGTPHIPTWIAGGGEQRTLRYVARWGDASNFGGTPEQFARKRDILHRHCDDVGRDPGTITNSTNLNVVVRATEAEARRVVDEVHARTDRTLPADQAGAAFKPEGAAVGSPEQVADRIRALQAAGCDYLVVYMPDVAYGHEGIDAFEEAVLPLLD
nr:TIGR03560 family F420-dependent LLM class oxidoreductase [Agrococcus jejuensis]